MSKVRCLGFHTDGDGNRVDHYFFPRKLGRRFCAKCTEAMKHERCPTYSRVTNSELRHYCAEKRRRVRREYETKRKRRR